MSTLVDSYRFEEHQNFSWINIAILIDFLHHPFSIPFVNVSGRHVYFTFYDLAWTRWWLLTFWNVRMVHTVNSIQILHVYMGKKSLLYSLYNIKNSRVHNGKEGDSLSLVLCNNRTICNTLQIALNRNAIFNSSYYILYKMSCEGNVIWKILQIASKCYHLSWFQKNE